jgi:hypothetical protein
MNAPEVLPTILTASGRYFPLLAPTPGDIRIEDIAHALSNLCRFTGHVREFYSVAQHSVLVSQIVPPEDALAGLLHDASEAYVTDISKPLKPHLGGYVEIETRIMEAVLKAFGLPTCLPPSVKRADLILLATEKRDLMPAHEDDWDLIRDVPRLGNCIDPWPPRAARAYFMDRFRQLYRRAA